MRIKHAQESGKLSVNCSVVDKITIVFLTRLSLTVPSILIILPELGLLPKDPSPPGLQAFPSLLEGPSNLPILPRLHSASPAPLPA